MAPGLSIFSGTNRTKHPAVKITILYEGIDYFFGGEV
jgi:hypothetical protein